MGAMVRDQLQIDQQAGVDQSILPAEMKRGLPELGPEDGRHVFAAAEAGSLSHGGHG